ncbi:hypothetical protein [Flavobacterium sp. GT3R68]|uniref:hypothetical protein n=1 Tax=Flavobacterium sp. GT3R68 TaxID=2594437 RepID=UPI000F863B1B|nr:hypothetical protein [Flavobacterium sp. GT3R68]RTY89139.1 hypothetical protein EKL32_24260 [Flavobacterium sp. GSN2]TRW90063.1 hypothetical protein FNW07_11430 [Flavobacterium sp. GT3R68]
MEVAFFISSLLIVLFALLALFDGFYLHILKYQLHNNQASRNEHLTHTLRAILFPCILYFLFIQQDSNASFYIGMFIVMTDIIILGFDAFLEKDSRQFMGGLPRWEYILHLFVNGFHFASIAVFLTLKLQLTDTGITIVPNLGHYPGYAMLNLIVKNLLPGAILMALIHVFVSMPKTALIWNKLRPKLTCC